MTEVDKAAEGVGTPRVRTVRIQGSAALRPKRNDSVPEKPSQQAAKLDVNGAPDDPEGFIAESPHRRPKWLEDWLKELQQRLPAFKLSDFDIDPDQGLSDDDISLLACQLPPQEAHRLQLALSRTMHFSTGHSLIIEEVSTRLHVDNKLQRMRDRLEGIRDPNCLVPDIKKLLEINPIENIHEQECSTPAYAFVLNQFTDRVDAAIIIQRAWRAYQERCRAHGKPEESEQIRLRRIIAEQKRLKAEARYLISVDVKKKDKMEAELMVKTQALAQRLQDELVTREKNRAKQAGHLCVTASGQMAEEESGADLLASLISPLAMPKGQRLAAMGPAAKAQVVLRQMKKVGSIHPLIRATESGANDALLDQAVQNAAELFQPTTHTAAASGAPPPSPGGLTGLVIPGVVRSNKEDVQQESNRMFHKLLFQGKDSESRLGLLEQLRGAADIKLAVQEQVQKLLAANPMIMEKARMDINLRAIAEGMPPPLPMPLTHSGAPSLSTPDQPASPPTKHPIKARQPHQARTGRTPASKATPAVTSEVQSPPITAAAGQLPAGAADDDATCPEADELHEWSLEDEEALLAQELRGYSQVLASALGYVLGPGVAALGAASLVNEALRSALGLPDVDPFDEDDSMEDQQEGGSAADRGSDPGDSDNTHSSVGRRSARNLRAMSTRKSIKLSSAILSLPDPDRRDVGEGGWLESLIERKHQLQDHQELEQVQQEQYHLQQLVLGGVGLSAKPAAVRRLNLLSMGPRMSAPGGSSVNPDQGTLDNGPTRPFIPVTGVLNQFNPFTPLAPVHRHSCSGHGSRGGGPADGQGYCTNGPYTLPRLGVANIELEGFRDSSSAAYVLPPLPVRDTFDFSSNMAVGSFGSPLRQARGGSSGPDTAPQSPSTRNFRCGTDLQEQNRRWSMNGGVPERPAYPSSAAKSTALPSGLNNLIQRSGKMLQGPSKGGNRQDSPVKPVGGRQSRSGNGAVSMGLAMGAVKLQPLSVRSPDPKSAMPSRLGPSDPTNIPPLTPSLVPYPPPLRHQLSTGALTTHSSPQIHLTLPLDLTLALNSSNSTTEGQQDPGSGRSTPSPSSTLLPELPQGLLTPPRQSLASLGSSAPGSRSSSSPGIASLAENPSLRKRLAVLAPLGSPGAVPFSSGEAAGGVGGVVPGAPFAIPTPPESPRSMGRPRMSSTQHRLAEGC